MICIHIFFLLFLATASPISAFHTKGGFVKTKWVIYRSPQQNYATSHKLQTQTVQVKFSCLNRFNGVYADVEFNCQLYHICNSWMQDSKLDYSQQSRSCPFGTRYDQKLLKCVNEKEAVTRCLDSPNLYPTSLIQQQFDHSQFSDVMIPISCPTAKSLHDSGAVVCQVHDKELIFEADAHSSSSSADVVPVLNKQIIGGHSSSFSSSHGSIHQINNRPGYIQPINTHQNIGLLQPNTGIQSNPHLVSSNTGIYQPTIYQQIVQPSNYKPGTGFSTLPANIIDIVGHRIDKSFTCTGKSYGYYADVKNYCHIYHVCTQAKVAIGKTLTHFSYYCSYGLIFDQKFLTCVKPEDSAVPCSEAEDYYHETAVTFEEKRRKETLLNAATSQNVNIPITSQQSHGQPFDVQLTRLKSTSNGNVNSGPVNRVPISAVVSSHSNIAEEQLTGVASDVNIASNQQTPPLSTSLQQGSNTAHISRVSLVNTASHVPQTGSVVGAPFTELHPDASTSLTNNQQVADHLKQRQGIVHNPQIIQTIIQRP